MKEQRTRVNTQTVPITNMNSYYSMKKTSGAPMKKHTGGGSVLHAIIPEANAAVDGSREEALDLVVDSHVAHARLVLEVAQVLPVRERQQTHVVCDDDERDGEHAVQKLSIEMRDRCLDYVV